MRLYIYVVCNKNTKEVRHAMGLGDIFKIGQFKAEIQLLNIWNASNDSSVSVRR